MILLLIILIALTFLYWIQISKSTHRIVLTEAYVDYITALEGPVALKDFLKVKTGLTSMTAESCAAADAGRQGELGGQYVQRTNNYRRDYPDSCSSRSDFVGSIYQPVALGSIVPCDGDC
jgi:hypothetical protein